MNEIKTSCAPADSRNLTWDGMNWSKCETYVRKLGIGSKEGYFQQREEYVWSR